MNSSSRLARNAIVLLTHRDRIAAATTFEEFKEAQIRLLDFLIEDQLADEKAEKAVNQFLGHQT